MTNRPSKANTASLPPNGGAVEVCSATSQMGDMNSPGYSGKQSGPQVQNAPAVVRPACAETAKHTTTIKTDNILLNIDLAPKGKVISRILTEVYSNQESTARLFRLAEIAYGQRDIESLKAATAVLLSLPLPQARDAGLFYLAKLEIEKGNTRQAKAIFEALSDSTNPTIRARAIQAIGVMEYDAGRFDQAGKHHSLARASPDPLTRINAQIQIALLTAERKNYHGSLEILNALWPCVRAASRLYPHLFYLLHNNAACDLLALNRIDEAHRASDVAARSPIADRYPSWQETAEEIRETETRPVIVAAPKVQPKVAAKVRAKERHNSRRNISGIIIPALFQPVIIEQATSLASITARVITSNPSTGPPVHAV